MNDIKTEQMQFIITKLLDNALDAKEKYIKDGRTDFDAGVLTAYYEMLDTIKNQLFIDEEDIKEFGLDIDLEKLLS